MVGHLKEIILFITYALLIGNKSMNFQKALFVVLVTIYATTGITANEDPVLTGEIFTEDAEDVAAENPPVESEPSVGESNPAPEGEIYALGDEIEWRERVKGGICGVFNPDSGEVEWNEQNKGGVAGVYNPQSRTIEWRQKYNNGVAGIFNPATGEIEWQENYKGGIAVVYNESTRQIEWKQIYKGDVAGVYNPITRQVEWREKPKFGIAGVFNPDTEKVEWREKHQVGIAGVLAGQPASLSCSSYANDYKKSQGFL
jgi:hypothetical protein